MTELTHEVVEAMLCIAKEDLLNPLYEQVVREFEEARIRLDHARNKLAQAVKLTDNDKLKELTKPKPDPAYYHQMMLKAAQAQMMQQMAGK